MSLHIVRPSGTSNRPFASKTNNNFIPLLLHAKGLLHTKDVGAGGLVSRQHDCIVQYR